MKKLLLICCVAVTLPLLVLVSYEAYYLLAVHLQVVGGLNEYQQMLYSEISMTAHALNEHMSSEDLLQIFNAENPHYLSREEVEAMPPWEKSRYKGFVNGSYLALDWAIYDIDPMLDYRGSLEIGSFEGDVQYARLVYRFNDED